MSNFKARMILKEGFRLYKRFWKPMTWFIILSFILSFFSNIGGKNQSFVSIVLLVVFTAVSAIVRYGSLKFAIDAAGHKHPTFRRSIELVLRWHILWRMVIASILVGAISLISFALLIVPFFFIAPRLVLVAPFILEGQGLRASFKKSWRFTKGQTWFIIKAGILATLTGILGFICLVVGIIPAAGITTMMLGVLYLRLSQNLHYKAGAHNQ